jgi:hypothetical protein
MRGAIPALLLYTFMAWCSVKAQGQLYLYLLHMRVNAGNFSHPAASRPALGPTQPPIQWVPRAVSLGVKRPEHEADFTPPSSAEVKECMEIYLHSTPSWHGDQLKHRDFTVTIYLYKSVRRVTRVQEVLVAFAVSTTNSIIFRVKKIVSKCKKLEVFDKDHRCHYHRRRRHF